MADQPQYTGATYASEYSKLPDETLSEYLMRLAKLRSQGILGGGGMLDVKEVPVVEKSIAYTPKLGQVVINAGSGDGDSNNTIAQSVPLTKDEQMRGNVLLQARQGGWEDVGEGLARALGAGVIVDAARGISGSKLEDEIRDERLYPEWAVKETMATPKSIVDAYSKGAFTSGVPDMTGISYEDAGDSLFYQLGTIPSRIGAALTGEVYDPAEKATFFVAGARDSLPQLPTVIGGLNTPAATAIPTDIVGGMFGNELGNRYSNTYTDSGTGTEYSVTGNADYTDGSWDTSGGGTNPDGSYDISGWFN